MNKKFSTLLAGMALLSVMSVNAQTTPSRVDPETVLGQEWRLGGLKEGANSGLYQLKVMDGTTPAYLAMELNRGTGDYELRVYSASEAKNNLEAHCGVFLSLIIIKVKLLFMTSRINCLELCWI